MKRYILIRLAAALFFIALLSLPMYQIYMVKTEYEAVLSNGDAYEYALADKYEEFSNYFSHFTCSAHQMTTLLGVDYEVIGADERYFYSAPFINGRPIDKDDIIGRKSVVAIDETISRKLFGTSNSIGRSFSLWGDDYKVIGVYYSQSPIGRPVNQLIIPISMIGDPQAMVFSAVAKPDAGMSFAFFEKLMNLCFADPVCYGMEREKYLAFLPLSFAAFCGCIYFSLRGFHKSKAILLLARKKQAERLKTLYFKDTIPALLWDAFKGFALIVLSGCIAYAALTIIAQPLYLFPEWLPENLTNLPEFFERIATNNGRGWPIIHYATYTVQKIRFWGKFLSATLFAFLVFSLFRRLKGCPHGLINTY